MKRRFLAISLFITTFSIGQKAELPSFNATLTGANVYYGYGAELTHKASLNLINGQQEIVVNNISNSVDQNTLQIGVPENVVLMSYRFNTKTETMTQLPNPSIKRMGDSIKVISKLINSNDQESQLNDELLNKTAKIIDSYSSTEKSTNTVEIIKLIDYYSSKVQYYRTTMYALKLKRDDLNEQLIDLSNRIAETKAKDGPYLTKTIGQLILQVSTTAVSQANIDISYYTQRAGWVPTYDMRVKSIDNTFKLSYKASVSQTTGIDWKRAKLTLSTSNPNLGTNIPVLNPWVLQYFVPEVYNNMIRGRAANSANYNRAQSMNKEEIVVTGYGMERKDLAASYATVDASDISNYTTLNESQLFTSFDIDLPYDIPTDGRSYSVAIKEENIKASYKHYAIPKLDKDAFLMAEISDWENLNLLPGEANIIMDNVYLGKSFIDPNTTMDTLNLSLGRDKRINVKRLLMKEMSKSKTIGANKTETFTYEITVKNNKKQAVNMLLKDQFPLSRVKEVEVSVDDKDGAELNEELGTLNWKINVPAGESKKYRFTYTVKYPKDKKIANLR